MESFGSWMYTGEWSSLGAFILDFRAGKARCMSVSLPLSKDVGGWFSEGYSEHSKKLA